MAAGLETRWIANACVDEGLPDSYADIVVHYLEQLSGRILELHRALSRPVIVGLNGGQGSGKSTLSKFLVEWLVKLSGLSAVCLSLDDFYFSKARRGELARSDHPLFITRGVPGTHDVAGANEVLDSLVSLGGNGFVRVPRFNKLTDDLYPEAEWPTVEAPVAVVVFEGWCVGAKPQSDGALEIPINALEREEDRDGRWRTAVNEHLKTDYAELFRRLDLLIMLRIPSFEKAIEWRQLQESKLRRDFDAARLEHFMMHFERLTRHILETAPAYSDAVIDVNDRHEFAGISWR